MPIRSHVDFCSFIRVIHSDIVDPDVAAMLTEAPDADRYSEAWRRHYQQEPGLVFHEGYHVWQGMRLPYLYWYGVLAVRAVGQMFDKLSCGPQPIEEWDCIVHDLYRLELPWWCWLTEEGSVLWGRDPEPPAGVASGRRLSPLDLLEGATSLAQYQVERGSKAASDLQTFTRWRKRTNSYLDAYWLAARILGDQQLALRSLLPMINAAFTTSDPVRAFIALLSVFHRHVHGSDMVKRFIAQPEPCRWVELFAQLMADHVASEFEGKRDATTKLLDPPFCELTLDNWLGATFTNGDPVQHPMLTALTREWRDREAHDPAYAWLLGQPAWAGEDRLRTAIHDFQPVTLVRFHLPGGGSRVIGLAAGLAGVDNRDVRDFLTVWSVVRRAAGVHFDPDNRLCHHTACPHYGANYCNTYPVVPERFEDCGFPARIARVRDDFRRRNRNGGDAA